MALRAAVWGCMGAWLALAGCGADEAVHGPTLADATAQMDVFTGIGPGPDVADAVSSADAADADHPGFDVADSSVDTADSSVDTADTSVDAAVSSVDAVDATAGTDAVADLISDADKDGETLDIVASVDAKDALGGNDVAIADLGPDAGPTCPAPLVQAAYVKASNTDKGDWFGGAVAIDGDTMVIGASSEASGALGIDGVQADNSAPKTGAAYVFVRKNGAWQQQAYLKASNINATTSGGVGLVFGFSVAISGDTIVVGAPNESNDANGVPEGALWSGAVYVFVRAKGVWTQQAYLKASTVESQAAFGWDVAIDGDTLAVSAPLVPDGAVEVFVRKNDIWLPQAQLNSGKYNWFGMGVAISGETIMVGGPGDAYFFVREGGVWTQQASLKASDTSAGAIFGDVALSGDTALIDAHDAKGGGKACVYVRQAGVWQQEAQLQPSNPNLKFLGVAIDGDHIAVGASAESSGATGIGGDQSDTSAPASGAAYLFTRQGKVWTQQAYVKASNAEAQDWFGSLALSGNDLVIGAGAEDSNATGVDGNQADNSAPDSGAVYVFVLDASCDDQNPCTNDACVAGKCLHTQNTLPCDDGDGCPGDVCGAGVCVGKPGGCSCGLPVSPTETYIKASNTEKLQDFGVFLAMDGDTMVVGSFGKAYVFIHKGGVWSQQATLKPPTLAGFSSYSGTSVAVSGDTIVVGSPDESKGGTTYVFVRQDDVWSLQASLKPSQPGAMPNFGHAVGISGDTIVIGDHMAGQGGAEPWYSGTAYVFVRQGSVWTQQAYLKGSNPGQQAEFGSSVAITGDTIVIGARNEASKATGVGGDQADSGAYGSGAAYVFVRQGSAWTQQAYLKASKNEVGAHFGDRAAISGETIAVSADGNVEDILKDATVSGAVYVFVRKAGVWTEQAALKASNASVNDGFGWGLALFGERLVVGAFHEASGATGIGGNQADYSAKNSGAAYLFERSGGAWSQTAHLKASNTEAGDMFGVAAALSDTTVVVGAAGESSKATGIKDGNQADNSAPASGAVYAFALDAGCDDWNPCTDDACSAGTCSHTNNTAPCAGGTCSGGACK